MNANIVTVGPYVWVERGPQIIALICNAQNLSDKVTATHYRPGGLTADGKVIMPGKKYSKKALESRGQVNEGDVMFVVDWKARKEPYVWKVYARSEINAKLAKVDEYPTKEAAITYAQSLAQELERT